MTVKVRYAPSPTGYQHAGNARTALVNWLFARKSGGHFLLRIDDTDTERSKPEYETAIHEDLKWLGVNWDSEAKQSTRFDRYHAAREKLAALGRLYACYETPEELDIQRKMQASRGLPPVYNRAGLKLTDTQKAKYESEGRKAHWRFLLEDTEVAWDDIIRGPVRMRATTMSDPVLVRADGVPVYTLASVTDDGELGITHVIRGEDHVSNTAVQIQLYAALDFSIPQFAHLALLKTKEGELSKRIGSGSLKELREQGVLPMAINSLLSRLGTSDAVTAESSLQALVESFDFKKFGRAPANFDPAELFKLDQKLIQQLPFEAVQPKFPYVTEEFWRSVKGNITSLSEVEQWWNILSGGVTSGLAEADGVFVREAAAFLPPEPWDEDTWDAWIAAVKTATHRKGKELFMPLRKALTGMEHGPELKSLLPLMGRSKAMERLTA
jgi:glutamyl-tRNA synthetase